VCSFAFEIIFVIYTFTSKHLLTTAVEVYLIRIFHVYVNDLSPDAALTAEPEYVDLWTVK